MNTMAVTIIPPEKAGPSDERRNLLSVTTAATLLGLKRTQMWRLATEGKIPSVVLGTSRRPIHFFRREDVLRLKREREAAKGAVGRRRRRKTQPELRKLLALLESGEISLRDLPPISRRIA